MVGPKKKILKSMAERAKKYREENREKNELNEAKRQLKRSQLLLTDTDKAKEMKEAAKLRKRASRERQKSENKENKALQNPDGDQDNTNDFNLNNSSIPGSSRQRTQGEKQRKKNCKHKNQSIKEMTNEISNLKKLQDKHDDELAELDIKLREIHVELERSEARVKLLESEKETDAFDNDDWLPKVYANMSTEGKRDFRNAFTVAAPSLKRGTITRLRRTTGLNFSINTSKTTEEESELKKEIAKFAENNTIDVPDKKKYSKGIRFRTSSLLCLYTTFDSHNPNKCTYQTFAKYWPAHCVKPLASELGTCLCIICQNMGLKIEALRYRKVISDFHLDSILEHSRQGDIEMETNFISEITNLSEENKSEIDIGFLEWNKVKQVEVSKNTGRPKGDKTMRISKHLPAGELSEIILDDFENYKNHLDRAYVMKQEEKKAKVEAETAEDLAVLHIDWAEQHRLIEIQEIQSAYFNGRLSYDIHTGYCYTKGDCHGFASLSDSSDHKAEAIHNALRPTIEELVAKGKKRFVICSDSPTSQYRNSKNCFLMKRFCIEFGISIRLLFTEAGHGKSPCDGVGGNIKTQVEAVAMNIFGENELDTIHSADDVARLIKEKTNLTYDITVHNKERTDEIRNSLPKLSPLVGAMTTHEVMITSDGSIKKKNLPSDAFYKVVTIKESRKPQQMDKELAGNVDLNGAFREDESETESEDSDVNIYL